MNNINYEYIDKFMRNGIRHNKKRDVLLPAIINEFKLTHGAEIGVFKGDHSLNILNKTNINLLMVDNYAFKNGHNVYNSVLEKFDTYVKQGRCSIIKDNSINASKNVKDNYLDFIYIDADHSYNGIKSDVESWYPKIKYGGLLSGHDYRPHKNNGVIKFINEFIKKHNLRLIVLGGRGSGWLCIK